MGKLNFTNQRTGTSSRERIELLLEEILRTLEEISSKDDEDTSFSIKFLDLAFLAPKILL